MLHKLESGSGLLCPYPFFATQPYYICPDGLEVTLTKSKIKYAIGSHTSGGTVTFEFQLRRAADSWASFQNFGTISLNNSNSVIFNVYTVDFSDIVLAPNDHVVVYELSRSGTVSERSISVGLVGTQKLQ